jgi:hypothetical protein
MSSDATVASGATDSIVLEEEIDPNYAPSEQEVVEYAKWLGMDLDKDEDLFWIGKEEVHITCTALLLFWSSALFCTLSPSYLAILMLNAIHLLHSFTLLLFCS